jgi:hypothetical protein
MRLSWHGQSERMGGMIDIAGRAASINPNGSACRIYAHAFHHREGDRKDRVQRSAGCVPQRCGRE